MAFELKFALRVLPLLALPTAGAQQPGTTCWAETEEARLEAGDAESGDNFGFSLAVWEDTAVIGALSDDVAGWKDAGSAYVFVKSGTTWSEEAKLTASDVKNGDDFGVSVAIWGETALVGDDANNAPGIFGNSGAAYVFVRNGTTWSEEAKLRASDGAAGDRFGISVALSGDTALVGAWLDDHSGLNNPGSAYVFARVGTTWTEQAKLTAFNPQTSDFFGRAVALEGDMAVVGNVGHALGGTADVFVRSGASWSQLAELTGADTEESDSFGDSLALLGDTLIVGAWSDDHSGALRAGSAYVFEQTGTTWSEAAKLVASDADDDDFFGRSASLSGDTALIGAYWDSHAGLTQAGSAYVFARSGAAWSEEVKLTSSDAQDGDHFGSSVALAGGSGLVGAWRDDHGGFQDAGSVYAFSPGASSSYCTAGTSASGCQAAISAVGTPSSSAASGFHLTASNVEGEKDGLFFFGTSGRQANPWGNGTSYQCVVPPVARGGLLVGSGPVGTCDGSFVQDLNAHWQANPAKQPAAGTIVQAQLWYRDPLNTSNQATSLSDALEFAVCP